MSNQLVSINTNTNPGWLGKAGAAIEANPGQPVKVGKLFSFLSFDPDKSNGMKRNAREDHQGSPDITGYTNGDAEFKFKLSVAATPEGILDELLCMGYGAPITTAVAVPATPAAPAVANVGAAGATNYSYTIVARSKQGDSVASAAGVTATGNAALTGNNYNHVTWAAIAGATSYLVIRGGNVIGESQALYLDDKGGNNGAYAAPGAPTGNQQLFTSGTSFLYGTVIVYEGLDYDGTPIVHVFSGSNLDKLQISFDKKAKVPLQFTADMIALWDAQQVTLASCGLDVATYDTLSPFSQTFAVCMIGGAIASVEKFGLSSDRKKTNKGSFTGYAGDVCSAIGPNTHPLTATLYWDSVAERRRFWGNAAASGSFSRVNNIYTFPVQMIVANPVNGAGIVNQFTIYSSMATYVEGPEPKMDVKDPYVMQDVHISPFVDPATGYALAMSNVNSRSNGNIITAGVPIVGISGGGVHPYSA